MKIFKASAAAVMAIVLLLCMIPFSAGAETYELFDFEYGCNVDPALYKPKYIYDENATVGDMLIELTKFCTYCDETYYGKYYYSAHPLPGSISLDFKRFELSEPMKRAYNLYKKYNKYLNPDPYIDDNGEIVYPPSGSVGTPPTKEKIREVFEQLITAAQNTLVDSSELTLLYRLCENENNDDNYYTDELWSDFSAKREFARSALNNSADDETVNSAYWDLLISMNKLCASNDVVGDVDNDKRVTIMDVTVMQKNIAGIGRLNLSQRFTVFTKSDSYKLTIGDATHLQKYISGYDVELSSGEDIKELQKYADSKLWRKNSMLTYAKLYFTRYGEYYC